jgi:hypothetical protein
VLPSTFALSRACLSITCNHTLKKVKKKKNIATFRFKRETKKGSGVVLKRDHTLKIVA